MLETQDVSGGCLQDVWQSILAAAAGRGFLRAVRCRRGTVTQAQGPGQQRAACAAPALRCLRRRLTALTHAYTMVARSFSPPRERRWMREKGPAYALWDANWEIRRMRMWCCIIWDFMRLGWRVFI